MAATDSARNLLTRKVAGIPVWGIMVVGVGLLGYILYRRQKAAAAASAATQDATAQTGASLPYVPTGYDPNAGYGYGDGSGFFSGPSGVADQGTTQVISLTTIESMLEKLGWRPPATSGTGVGLTLAQRVENAWAAARAAFVARNRAYDAWKAAGFPKSGPLYAAYKAAEARFTSLQNAWTKLAQQQKASTRPAPPSPTPAAPAKSLGTLAGPPIPANTSQMLGPVAV